MEMYCTNRGCRYYWDKKFAKSIEMDDDDGETTVYCPSCGSEMIDYEDRAVRRDPYWGTPSEDLGL